ncbi:MAG: hypothetical protein IT372_31880 [Polyangiaceae bacterium]|nr:hypothetical protein [Polyangiaceae bacterium]
MRTRALGLLLVALAASCDPRGCGGAPPGDGAPGAAEPRPALPPRERIVGVWDVGPSKAAREKMKADLRKAARGDEQRLAEMLREWEASTAGATLELTGEALITRVQGKQVSAERYEVTAEAGQTLTIRLARAKRDQALTFEDDDTVATELGDLGSVTLKRR